MTLLNTLANCEFGNGNSAHKRPYTRLAVNTGTIDLDI